MVKQLYFSGLMLFFLCAASQTNNPAPFCAQTNSLGPNASAPITNVKLSTATTVGLNNSSVWGTGGFDYTYYNNLPTHTIVLGVPQILSVTFGASNLFNSLYFSVFIDLNADNQFSASERIFDNLIAGNVPIPVATAATFTVGFTIQTATLGITRMRVIRGGNPNQTTAAYMPGFFVAPCPAYPNIYLYGEAEDYDVTIATTPATAGFNLFSNSICPGSTVSPLDQSSNNVTTYSWVTTGAVPPTSTLQAPQFIYPATGIYSISLTVSNATSTSVPVVKTITVNPSPAISILSSIGGSTLNVPLCRGKSATLTASGATTYTWSTGSSATSLAITPTITTTYSVTATNAFGCSSSAAKTLSVQNCTGVDAWDVRNAELTVYPNPGKGLYQLRIAGVDNKIYTVDIFNSLGQLAHIAYAGDKDFLDLSGDMFKSGIYFVKLRETNSIIQKVLLVKD